MVRGQSPQKNRISRTPKETIIMTTTEQINNLENEIAELHCGLTYNEILKVAILMAKKIKNSVPMYTGGLNLVWQTWDEIQTELERILNLQLDI